MISIEDWSLSTLSSQIFGSKPSYNCDLGTRIFLLVAGLVGRRQDYNCNLETRDFWGQAQLEGDTATTAIWELEVFWCRPS